MVVAIPPRNRSWEHVAGDENSHPSLARLGWAASRTRFARLLFPAPLSCPPNAQYWYGRAGKPFCREPWMRGVPSLRRPPLKAKQASLRNSSPASANVEYSISDMDRVVVCGSLILFGVVLLGAFRTVFELRFPFVRKLDTVTWQAYAVLAIAAIGLLGWRFTDLRRIQSFEIAGVKATLGNLQQKVDTLSDQMEAFFKRKKTEVFDKHNWNQVRRVGISGKKGVVLEVTLEQEPIVNSVEVFEGVLLMPEQDYQIDGRVVRFSANTDKPEIGLTVKYYPRVVTAVRGGQ